MEASNGGAIELARGTYQEMREEYEQTYGRATDEIYGNTQGIRRGQRADIWDLQSVGNGRYDVGNRGQTRIEGISTDAAGDDEYLRGRNQGTSAGKENIRKSLKNTVRTQKYLLETTRQLRKTVDLLRVTVIIRTRQKCSIKAIFVAFAVALRKQGCHLKTTNLIFTPSIFDALQFIVCRFGLNRGKNAVNPYGFTSILTKSKGKSAAINRGSDYFRYPIQEFKLTAGHKLNEAQMETLSKCPPSEFANAVTRILTSL